MDYRGLEVKSVRLEEVTMYELDAEKEKTEHEIIESIYHSIDEKKSFYFQSGAGAGKTYALVKAIKYAGQLNAIKKNNSSRKILCITYTNNATNEIAERLPSSEHYYVSTIHYFIWDLLKNYNKELIETHVSFLGDEIKRLEYMVFHDPDSHKSYKKFRSLSVRELDLLIEKIREDKINYYEVAFGPAVPYWSYLESVIGTDLLSAIKSNKQDVYDAIKTLLTIRNYKKCLDSIKTGDPNYKDIIYKANQNIEILHLNVIGHDTLLKYAKILLLKNIGLSRVVIDAYPYVFIDECQDTNPDIIDFFSEIYTYSKSSSDCFILGFFGDPMQTIFSKEIVKNPFYESLNLINKDFNRRSFDEVINCINIIRGSHQPIIQTSIYKDKQGGEVKFQQLGEECNEQSIIRDIINGHKREWHLSPESSFACLVLKNKMLATLCDFDNIYRLVSKIYTAENPSYHNKVNEEFVVRELKKAGRLAMILHNIMLPLFLIVRNKNLSLSELFPIVNKSQFSLKEVREAISFLQGFSNCSLLEYVEGVRRNLNGCVSPKTKEIIESIFPKKMIDLNASIDSTILELSSFKRVADCSVFLSELLDINVDEFFNWMDYLHGESKLSGIDYMTCHSAKGLEFDNVLIFLEDSMLHDKNIFSELLTSDLNVTLNEKLERARRILYVSVSRAIKNASIVLFSKNNVDFNT